MPRIRQRIWFERSFSLGYPVEAFPELLERLRGTPDRLAERMGQFGAEQATHRVADKWSALEHAGHLSDLEPLWSGRVDDLCEGQGDLRAADLENRATWDADHNARTVQDVVLEFRERRAALIRRLEAMTVADLVRSATHPRLLQPMTAMDLCFFVAEHDDHHLAAITALLSPE